MPYIPPNNRPVIDKTVDALADQLANDMCKHHHTAELSVYYRTVFHEITDFISATEKGASLNAATPAQSVAQSIIETAKGYNLKGGWTGELNYAITMLIQLVPYKLYKKKEWEEPLRYWIYAETVGALTRTAYDIHSKTKNDYIGNGLCGVFEDIKDEYKRRVNTAYEAAQIRKSGDCFDYVPFKTQLVPFKVENTEGYIEIMQPEKELP